MAQDEDQIGKFCFFQLCHQFLVLFQGKLAGIILKDGFHGFARWSVKQSDGGHVFTEWFCDMLNSYFERFYWNFHTFSSTSHSGFTYRLVK